VQNGEERYRVRGDQGLLLHEVSTRAARTGPSGGVASPNRRMSALLNGPFPRERFPRNETRSESRTQTSFQSNSQAPYPGTLCVHAVRPPLQKLESLFEVEGRADVVEVQSELGHSECHLRRDAHHHSLRPPQLRG
jgi:hypothetical protein